MMRLPGVVPVVVLSATRWEITGTCAVVGLAIGSFLNVVVYRVPRGLSIVHPGSFCPVCARPVRAVDNVPVVSWVLLGGRCRHCGHRISVRYPFVELATSVLFAATGWGLGPHWGVAGFCVLAATVVALVAVALDGLTPPVSVAIVGTAMAVVLLVAAGLADHRPSRVVGVAVGVAVATVLVGITRRRSLLRRDLGLWTRQAPVLLPVGTALGWLGPAYAGIGLGAAVSVLVASRVARPVPVRTPGDTATTPRCLFGFALAVGVAVAVTVAVAAGSGAGR